MARLLPVALLVLSLADAVIVVYTSQETGRTLTLCVSPKCGSTSVANSVLFEQCRKVNNAVTKAIMPKRNFLAARALVAWSISTPSMSTVARALKSSGPSRGPLF